VKDELFEMAELIVGRAGHSTIGQCIDRGKPAVLVPIYNHPEQLGNAEKFSRLGLGIGIRSERLTVEGLVEAVRECMNDGGYREKAEAASRVSKRFDGVGRTVEVIRSYA
jgi:UDP:flavonoid glycosyltransferase YjiC (YdhE family)